MSGLQPKQLTNEELRRYASLYTFEQLPKEWVEEIVKRFVSTPAKPC